VVTDAASKRQQRAAATAEQLLAAAREVFESKGYMATTVGAITEAANTAHGTFYLYFKNKEDVFAKVMAQVADDLYREARAPWAGDPYEALELATRGYLEVFSSHRGLWRCLMEGMHQSPALGEMWLASRRPFVDRIQRNLERLAAAGSIRQLDPRLAAAALGSMVEWTSFCYVELGEPAGTASLEELAHTLTDLWFNAVYGREGPKPPD
jgi:AcrR family transcriptional regulator